MKSETAGTTYCNQLVQDGDWTCNLVFRRDGDASTVINALANATFSVDDYQCNASFTEYDNRLCVAVVAQANAQVRGDKWNCNLGSDRTESDSYRRIK